MTVLEHLKQFVTANTTLAHSSALCVDGRTYVRKLLFIRGNYMAGGREMMEMEGQEGV